MSVSRGFVAGFLASLLFVAAPVAAQQQSSSDQILEELKAIRKLLEKLVAAAPPSVAAPSTDDRVRLARVIGNAMGRPDAPLTMIEFTDLQCPFCRQFSVTTLPQIKKEYIDTGKLRFISRDYPLESLHPLAVTSARASWCADGQGRFWEMRHTILLNNAELTSASFATFARDLGLNVPKFEACMTSSAERFQRDLDADRADAAAAGVTAAPTFIIGRTSANGLDGIRVTGAQPFSAFDARLRELLAGPR